MKITTMTVAVLCVATLAASPLGAAEATREKTPMAEMLEQKSGDAFEAEFLGMMTLHHQDGLKMGEMAMEKGSSSKLKEMMQKSSKEQQQEIEKMTGWLQQWHKKTPNDFSAPAESKQTMQKHMAELKALSGAEFDKRFAHHMAEHHLDSIAMAKLAKTKAQHREVKELAGKIEATQEKEREQLLKMSGSSSGDETAQFTCPMHPEVVQNSAGKCPKCGMALERKKPAKST